MSIRKKLQKVDGAGGMSVSQLTEKAELRWNREKEKKWEIKR